MHDLRWPNRSSRWRWCSSRCFPLAPLTQEQITCIEKAKEFCQKPLFSSQSTQWAGKVVGAEIGCCKRLDPNCRAGKQYASVELFLPSICHRLSFTLLSRELLSWHKTLDSILLLYNNQHKQADPRNKARPASALGFSSEIQLLFFPCRRPCAATERDLPLQAGQAQRVLKFAERWAASADPSLVRHFIVTLLASCAPPFSSDFAASLLRCVAPAKHLPPLGFPSPRQHSFFLR